MRYSKNEQKMKGQHALCMSLDSSEEIDNFLSNSCFINPNIFYPEGWKKKGLR